MSWSNVGELCTANTLIRLNSYWTSKERVNRKKKALLIFSEWIQFTSWAKRCPCKKSMKHKPFFSAGHLQVQISCNKHHSLHCCNGICHFAFGRNAALVSLSSLCPLSSLLVLGKAACTALQETRSRNLPRWKNSSLCAGGGGQKVLFFNQISFPGRFIMCGWITAATPWEARGQRKESRENKQLGRDCWQQQCRWREKIVELQLARNEQSRSFPSWRKCLHNYKLLFRSNTGLSNLPPSAMKFVSLPSETSHILAWWCKDYLKTHNLSPAFKSINSWQLQVPLCQLLSNKLNMCESI